jgi:site-specific DNA-methyltransferase (cytosine-N4-specific)
MFRQEGDPPADAPVASGKIVVGDSRKVLASLEASRFQTVVTSPPYWGLRDYGVRGQIGAEPIIKDYLADLVAIFREVRRVLSDDGTVWFNIGDSYTSGGRTWRQTDKKSPARGMDYRAPTPEGLKPKDLIGVPWRIAFALQADGWYLRSDIIWHKPNGIPESVKDRPSRVHEYIFLLTKSEKYFYNYEAVKEPAEVNGQQNGHSRARRSVWSINTEPVPDAHFATYPPALVRPCILAGTRPGDEVLDPFLGSGTTGQVALRLGRNFTGVELKDDYAEMARKRILRHTGIEVPIIRSSTPTSHEQRNDPS